jgi:hypothetical protein
VVVMMAALVRFDMRELEHLCVNVSADSAIRIGRTHGDCTQWNAGFKLEMDVLERVIRFSEKLEGL